MVTVNIKQETANKENSKNKKIKGRRQEILGINNEQFRAFISCLQKLTRTNSTFGRVSK